MSGRRADAPTIGSRFNDEMGFVPRVGVDNAEGYLGAHLRFKKYSSWLREFFPHFQIENFTKRNGGGLESRYMDWHVPITLQNSAFIEAGVNPNEEVIDDGSRSTAGAASTWSRAATRSRNTSSSPIPTPARRSR
jgi:hypothetical protein